MTKPRHLSARIEESLSKGRRMNIVFDMTFPRRLNTGTTVYANELVAAIGRRDICGVTCLAETPPARRRGIWKLWNGIRNIFWVQVVLPVKLFRLKADLLHAPSFFAPIVWCPCPIVLTVHDTLFLTRGMRHSNMLFSLYARIFIAAAVRRSKIICTVSNAARNDIISHYHMPNERIRVIYHGVSPRFSPQPATRIAEIRKRHKLDGSYFLFVGTWAPRKNLPRLIEAFRLFRKNPNRKHQLILVGPQGSDATEVQRAMNDPELAGEVRWLGFIEDDDMPCIYAAADAFVFPSLGEGFGMPVIEAMACGTPVITSSVSCLPEVAGDAALFVDPNAAADIARAMEEIIQPNVSEDLRCKGLLRSQLFTWETAAERTEMAYVDALK